MRPEDVGHPHYRDEPRDIERSLWPEGFPPTRFEMEKAVRELVAVAKRQLESGQLDQRTYQSRIRLVSQAWERATAAFDAIVKGTDGKTCEELLTMYLP